MGALVVTGCSTGQATPLTTKHSAILVTTQGATTPSDRGTLTGEVCEPLQGPPEARVTVSLDQNPAGEQLQQVRSETVPRNGRYRFRSVVPGYYLLVGEWPDSPLFRTSASVSARQTSVVNLGTCVPTTGVHYKPASAGQVRRFMAEATAGGDRAFSATYRYLGGEIYAAWPTGQTFFFAQRPHGPASMGPWGAGDFAYLARKGSHALEFIQRAAHDYECVRNKPGAPWSCEGPNHRSIMNALATLFYDVPASLLRDMPQPTKDVAMSSGTLNGLKVTCLRYRVFGDGSLATWCLTAKGITAFAASSDLDNVEMVNLSASLPAGVFAPCPRGEMAWVHLVRRLDCDSL